MIATKNKINSAVDEQYEDWCTGFPWFNETIFKNPHGSLLGYCFVTAREGIYVLMCGFNSYNQPKSQLVQHIFMVLGL